MNVMFTAEGEEELGSPHFPQIIQKYADRLKTADAVLYALSRPAGSEVRELVVTASEEGSYP